MTGPAGSSLHGFPGIAAEVVEAYLDAPDTMVAEVVDGQLSLTARPRPQHAQAATRLSRALGGFHDPEGDDPGGWIILVEPELRLGPRPDIVVPDLAGWRRDRLPEEPAEAAIRVAPDWVCEILSDGTEAMDRGPKRRVYRREGVGHLWLCDPRIRTLEVYRLESGRWLELDTFEGDTKVRAEPFEGMDLEAPDRKGTKLLTLAHRADAQTPLPAPPPAPRVYYPSPRVKVFTSLTYQRTAGARICPGDETLRAELARCLGHDPFTPDPEGISAGHVRILLTRTLRGFVASYDWTPAGDAQPSKGQFDAPGSSQRDCHDILDSVVINLAAAFSILERKYGARYAPKPAAPAAPARQRPAWVVAVTGIDGAVDVVVLVVRSVVQLARDGVEAEPEFRRVPRPAPCAQRGVRERRGDGGGEAQGAAKHQVLLHRGQDTPRGPRRDREGTPSSMRGGPTPEADRFLRVLEGAP